MIFSENLRDWDERSCSMPNLIDPSSSESASIFSLLSTEEIDRERSWCPSDDDSDSDELPALVSTDSDSGTSGSAAETDASSYDDLDSSDFDELQHLSHLSTDSSSDSSYLPELREISSSESSAEYHYNDDSATDLPPVLVERSESPIVSDSTLEELISPLRWPRPSSSRGNLYYLDPDSAESPLDLQMGDSDESLYDYNLHPRRPPPSLVFPTPLPNTIQSEISSPMSRAQISGGVRMRRRGAIFQNPRHYSNLRSLDFFSGDLLLFPQRFRRSTSFPPVTPSPCERFPDRGPYQHHRPILDILKDYGMWMTDISSDKESTCKKRHQKRWPKRKKEPARKNPKRSISRKSRFRRFRKKERRVIRRS